MGPRESLSSEEACRGVELPGWGGESDTPRFLSPDSSEAGIFVFCYYPSLPARNFCFSRTGV